MWTRPNESFLPHVPLFLPALRFTIWSHATVYSWMILANFLPLLVACACWFGIDGSSATWIGFVVLIVMSAVGIAITGYFLREKMQEDPTKWTWGSIWWEVTFSNIFELKGRAQPTIQYIPDVWAYLIKGIIPHLLIVVFVNAAAATNGDGKTIFWHYGNYPAQPYQAMGVVCITFALALFVAGFFYPQIYAPLATAYEGDNQDALKSVDEVDDMVEKIEDKDLQVYAIAEKIED